jgi:hypothetical protein
MSRSLSYLRRGLLGIAFAGSLGFGATQAFARSGGGPIIKYCPATGEDYPYSPCASGCDIGRGYCTAEGRCVCGDLP